MTLGTQISHLQGIPSAGNVQGGFALLSQMQQICLWLHPNQYCAGSSYDAQDVVLTISLLSVCSAIQDILNLCSYKLIPFRH